MIPTQPTNLLPRPFATGGTYQLVPDAKLAPGRASFKDGFPTETQLPLNLGGIAPNRMDFNGMFYMLSAFAFWQQSGGMFTYNAALNYAPPSLVFHAGKLWWCVAANGPEVSGVGVKTPGTNENYWLEFLKALAQMGGSNVIGNPVGTVITFWGTTAPDGYLACNGGTFSATAYPKLYTLLGAAKTPDMRGYFVRGYDTRNTIDPDGASRSIGSTQQDAIRNIVGEINSVMNVHHGTPSQSGALWTDNQGGSDLWIGNGSRDVFHRINFNASRSVPTSTENRPKNVALLYCIKHD